MLVAILGGWTPFNSSSISDGSTDYFWPFDNEPKIQVDYDFSNLLYMV